MKGPDDSNENSVGIPADNEELLIGTTVGKLPEFVDDIVVVNDGSTDDTSNRLHELAKDITKLVVLDNAEISGVGGALMAGYKYVMESTDAAAGGIVAGDDQFDTSYLQPMLDQLIDGPFDYVKASRFFHREVFKTMPKHRRFGNILISLL